MTEFKKPEPAAWGMLDSMGHHIGYVIPPEAHARDPGGFTIALYTAETLRDVLEQAARHVESGGTAQDEIIARQIRAMKGPIK